MNSALCEEATCVCHYTEANVSLHTLRCNLNSFTDKQPASRYFRVCVRSCRRQNILLEPAGPLSFRLRGKKKKNSNAFQKPLLLQLPLNSLLHPRAMTWSYFFLWSNCCFLSAALCHGVQGHVSDCCIITSSKVGETAAGDQQARAGPAFTLKTLVLISRLNEHFPPQSGSKRWLPSRGG